MPFYPKRTFSIANKRLRNKPQREPAAALSTFNGRFSIGVKIASVFPVPKPFDCRESCSRAIAFDASPDLTRFEVALSYFQSQRQNHSASLHDSALSRYEPPQLVVRDLYSFISASVANSPRVARPSGRVSVVVRILSPRNRCPLGLKERVPPQNE